MIVGTVAEMSVSFGTAVGPAFSTVGELLSQPRPNPLTGTCGGLPHPFALYPRNDARAKDVLGMMFGDDFFVDDSGLFLLRSIVGGTIGVHSWSSSDRAVIGTLLTLFVDILVDCISLIVVNSVMTYCLPNGISNTDIMNDLPKDAQFISIGRKYVSDKHVLSQTESNLSILVFCLGHSGIKIKGFDPCYVTVSAVRHWISQFVYRKERVLFNSLIVEEYQCNQLKTPEKCDLGKSSSLVNTDRVPTLKSIKSSRCQEVEHISGFKLGRRTS